MNGYSIEYRISRDMLEEYWRWRVGRPVPIWINQLDAVEKTIKSLKLSPLGREHYPHIEFGQQAPMGGTRVARVPHAEQIQAEELIAKDFPGGLRCPHLHYKRDIYLLNDEQWKTFSDIIIEGFKDKLSRIGTVSFEQMIRVSEAFDSLA